MKHLKKGRKLSRKRDQRKALLKSMARNLFLKGKIKTTQAKSKELRSFAEKCITRAKIANLSSRRMLLRYFSPSLTKKIIEDIAPRYESRNGGYTRINNLGERISDGAKIVLLELIK